MHTLSRIIAIAVVLAIAPHAADATCSEEDGITDTPLSSVTGAASALSPVATNPVLNLTIVASGSSLYSYDTDALTGSEKERYTPAAGSGTIESNPMLVTLWDGDHAVFFTTSNGYLHRVNVAEDGTMTAAAGAWPRYLGRCSADTLTATPTIHLWNYGSPAFKAAYTTDVVYIGTHYQAGCSGDEAADNQVYAINADTGVNVRSPFNSLKTMDIDFISQGAYIDFENDLLYVGTEKNGMAAQDSLWAIDVLTGTKAWSASIGSVQSTPIMYGDQLYVTTVSGWVRSVNKSDGTVAWSKFLTDNLYQSPSVERRTTGGYQGSILVTGSGIDNAVYKLSELDFGGGVTFGVLDWSATLDSGGSAPTGRPYLDVSSGYVYVGADDGLLYQLSASDGSEGQTREVDAGSIVGDLMLVLEDTNGSGSYDDVRMIAGSEGGVVAKFCGPWSAPPMAKVVGAAADSGISSATAQSNCAGDAGNCDAVECATASCVNNVCVYSAAGTEGNSCDDGVPETSGETCRSGSCIPYSECTTPAGQASCQCNNEYGKPQDRSLGNAVVNMSNTCLYEDSNGRSVISVHIVDQVGIPITGATVQFGVMTGVGPTFRKVSDDSDQGASGFFPATESGRPGTYFAILGPPAKGSDQSDQTVQLGVRITKSDASGTCIDNPSLQGIMMVANSPVTGCSWNSNSGTSGYLRVTVMDMATGGPIDHAQVMVGALVVEADDSAFPAVGGPTGPYGDLYQVLVAGGVKFNWDYDGWVDNQTSKLWQNGDYSNIQRTGTNPNTGGNNAPSVLPAAMVWDKGVAEFHDMGTRLNGPNRVHVTCPDGAFGDDDTVSLSTSAHEVTVTVNCP